MTSSKSQVSRKESASWPRPKTQRAMKRLYTVVPLALLPIFLLIYSTFNSFRHAALIIANVPFALVVGAAAVWLRAPILRS